MNFFGRPSRRRQRTPEPEVVASDGLRARANGPWAKHKLSFLDDYGPAALQATRGKRDRWYIDLFAGPGVNVNRNNIRDEWRGSAIRALRMHGLSDLTRGFDRAVLVNKDPDDHAALVERVRREADAGHLMVSRDRIELLCGDSNALVRSIMDRVHPQAYAFVLADIEAPSQLPWSTIAELRRGGHESVDLYVLFPLAMGLNRMLSRNPASVEQCAPVLTAFFGSESWRPIWERRQRGEYSSHGMRAALVDLYLGQLRAIPWKYADVARDVRRIGRSKLYHMLYATDHPVGGTLAAWAAGKPTRDLGQVSLFDLHGG